MPKDRLYGTRSYSFAILYGRNPKMTEPTDLLPIDRRNHAAAMLRSFRRNTGFRGVPTIDTFREYFATLRLSNRLG